MAKSRDGNYIPPKGKPSGNNREADADLRTAVEEAAQEQQVITNVHILHRNRNVSKGEEDELAEKNGVKNNYKSKPDTLQDESAETSQPKALPEKLSKDDLAQIAQYSGKHCITIYLPTHRSGAEVNEQQDAIAFKNALQEVQKELRNSGCPAQESEQILLKGFTLAKDELFWRQQQQGLAVFLAPDYFRYVQLPYTVSAMNHICESFYISPLMPLLEGRDAFYLLALSKHKATLYEGDGYGMHEVPVPGMPRGIEDVVHFEEKDDQKLFRTGGSGAGQGANYHGIGAGKPDEKENISMYMDEVDETLWKEVLSTQHIPLVLAGVDYLIPIFKQRTKYRNIAEENLSGNYERETIPAMFEKATAILQPYFEQPRQKALDRYFNNSTNGLTSSIPSDVIPACYYSRAEILLIQKDAHVWGKFNMQDNQLTVNDTREAGDQCLLNAAAVQAMRNGAQVFVLDKEQMPEGAVMAALMRY